MKKLIAFSAGILAGGLIYVAVKKTIAKKTQTTTEDEELANRVYEDLDQKYGTDTKDEFQDVQNVKADAINHGYTPVQY